MKIASLFSGCGGLDLGFTNAGFQMVYANDFDKMCWETFEKNIESYYSTNPPQSEVVLRLG